MASNVYGAHDCVLLLGCPYGNQRYSKRGSQLCCHVSDMSHHVSLPLCALSAPSGESASNVYGVHVCVVLLGCPNGDQRYSKRGVHSVQMCCHVSSCVITVILLMSMRRAGSGPISADATWLPLLKTPAHPEYPSTHTVTAGASAQTLARCPFSADRV